MAAAGTSSARSHPFLHKGAARRRQLISRRARTGCSPCESRDEHDEAIQDLGAVGVAHASAARRVWCVWRGVAGDVAQ